MATIIPSSTQDGQPTVEKISRRWAISRVDLAALGYTLKRVVAIAGPFWTSPQTRVAAWVLTALFAVVQGVIFFFMAKFSYLTASLIDALTSRKFDLVMPLLYQWGGFLACSVAVSVLQVHVTGMLDIRWRRFLTEAYMDKYVHGGVFNQLELGNYGIDNPDQRISEDINNFSLSTVSLLFSVVQVTGTVIVYSVILWKVSGALEFHAFGNDFSIPGYMFWVAVFYSAFITWLTHAVGSPLGRLNFLKQKVEAEFRFHLVRLRENAESIALLGGDRRERSALAVKFGNVYDNFTEILKYRRRLAGIGATMSTTTQIFPYIAAMPALVAGTVKLGGFIQIREAFGLAQGQMVWFAASYQVLAAWKAGADRLVTLDDAIKNALADRANSGLQCKAVKDGGFLVADTSIDLPNGVRLLSDVGFDLKPGQHVIVTGRSGSGKSTLFRVLSGQWVWGQGEIETPADGTLFLPQKPFIPLGSLRDALTYPARRASIDEAELVRAMHACKLAKFVDRLDEHAEWSRILSGGEQQRLSFVRALLAKPDWLLLDEATSALDPGTEECLYAVLLETLPDTTIVSIAHRPSLKKFHDIELKLDPDASMLSIEVIDKVALAGSLPGRAWMDQRPNSMMDQSSND